MSLFDTVKILCPLPENTPEFIKKCPVFQTSDLGEGMGNYIVTKEGKLCFHSDPISMILCKALGTQLEDIKPVEVVYKRKKIELYSTNIIGGKPGKNDDYIWLTNNGEDAITISYILQIRNGKVSSIKEKNRSIKSAQKFEE